MSNVIILKVNLKCNNEKYSLLVLGCRGGIFAYKGDRMIARSGKGEAWECKSVGKVLRSMHKSLGWIPRAH